MSILVHPDKNLDDTERAQKAFDGMDCSFVVVEKLASVDSCIY